MHAQQVLFEGTKPTDHAQDGTLLGELSPIDGIIGPQTLRQLWVYLRLLRDRSYGASVTNAVISTVAADARSGRVSPSTVEQLLAVAYHWPRLYRKARGAEAVAAPRVPNLPTDMRVSVMSDAQGLPRYREAPVVPSTPETLAIEPAYKVWDQSIPPLPQQIGWLLPMVSPDGSLPSASWQGPWTLSDPPVVVEATVPVAADTSKVTASSTALSTVSEQERAESADASLSTQSASLAVSVGSWVKDNPVKAGGVAVVSALGFVQLMRWINRPARKVEGK
jgi:hypothetical protein